MPAKAKQTNKIDRQLVHVLRHPVRMHALTILNEREASPKEIAEELLEPVGTVSHHVRELEKMELIELVREEPRRGAVEHYFRGRRRPMLSEAEWSEISLEEREKITMFTWQLILSDAARAMNAGLFDGRTDRHHSRVPLVLDEQGFAEAIQIQEDALAAIIHVQARARERLDDLADEDVVYATASLSCFEGPAPAKEQRPE